MGFYNTIEAAEAAHNAAKEAKRYGMSALERHHANYSNVKNASKLRPKRNGELPKPKPISDTDRCVLVMVERYSYLTANVLRLGVCAACTNFKITHSLDSGITPSRCYV